MASQRTLDELLQSRRAMVEQSIAAQTLQLVGHYRQQRREFQRCCGTRLVKFVAVGSGTRITLVTSAGLSSWNAATTHGTWQFEPLPDGLNAVATERHYVVAVGDSGKIWYSTDASVLAPTSVNSSDLYRSPTWPVEMACCRTRWGVVTSTTASLDSKQSIERFATDRPCAL